MRQLLRLVGNGKELGASVLHSMCDATHSCVSYGRSNSGPAQPSSRNRSRHGSTCLLLASCAALSPYRSLAFSVISGTLASACETGQSRFCLLYTSDAADDLLCVDLGGR